jgi:hypothetical protein
MTHRAHLDNRDTSDGCEHATVVVSFAAHGTSSATPGDSSVPGARRYPAVLLPLTGAPTVRSSPIHGSGSWLVAP